MNKMGSALTEKILYLLNDSIQSVKDFNKISWQKIQKWQNEAKILQEEFMRINNFDFHHAEVLIDKETNPSTKYNLNDFLSFKKIKQNVEGELFTIHQRNKMLERNITIMLDIQSRKMNQKKIDAFKTNIAHAKEQLEKIYAEFLSYQNKQEEKLTQVQSFFSKQSLQTKKEEKEEKEEKEKVDEIIIKAKKKGLTKKALNFLTLLKKK